MLKLSGFKVHFIKHFILIHSFTIVNLNVSFSTLKLRSTTLNCFVLDILIKGWKYY